MITVLKPGLLTTPQDGGRAGHTQLGVGRASAFDAPAFGLANALAGNPPDACALELTLLGPSLRFHGDAWVAVTGAALPVRLDDREMPMWSPLRVCAGQTLALGSVRSGCRAYLAVRGGFEFEPVLGSRSLDVNAALGPFGRPLRAGDELKTRDAESGQPEANKRADAAPSHWSIDPGPWFDIESALRLLPGTQTHLLDDASREALFAQTFRVGHDSNRVGLRLEGVALALAAPFEAISEGCVPGTLQLPPSGQPIALGVEGPVSGGYPRIGQIAAIDLPRLAQARPGDALRFAPCTLGEALRALRERKRVLLELERRIALRLARAP